MSTDTPSPTPPRRRVPRLLAPLVCLVLAAALVIGLGFAVADLPAYKLRTRPVAQNAPETLPGQEPPLPAIDRQVGTPLPLPALPLELATPTVDSPALATPPFAVEVTVESLRRSRRSTPNP